MYSTQMQPRLIVHGMVISHFDYANALYYGLPENSIKKLQRVQNMAAKVILGKKRSDSSRRLFNGTSLVASAGEN